MTVSRISQCPFCGGDSFATGYTAGDTYLFRAYCSKCPAEMRGFDQCQQDAIDAWSLRSQGGSSDLRQAVAKMREIADFNHDNRFGRLALEAIADLEASCSPPGSARREPLMAVTASLAAAISLLERTPKSKKAAPSDKMFDQMIRDYKKALEAGRAALVSRDSQQGAAE